MESLPYKLGILVRLRIKVIGSISTYTPALGASSRTGHPMLLAGAAHGIAGIFTTTTNDFQEFLRSRLQIGHDWQ